MAQFKRGFLATETIQQHGASGPDKDYWRDPLGSCRSKGELAEACSSMKALFLAALLTLVGCDRLFHHPTIVSAVSVRDRKDAKYLLEKGFDPNAIDIAGNSALIYAIRHMKDLGMTALLIKYGANPNMNGSEGFSPLSLAVLEDSLPIAQALLEGGANPDFAGRRGMTPRKIAEELNQEEFIALFSRSQGTDSPPSRK